MKASPLVTPPRDETRSPNRISRNFKCCRRKVFWARRLTVTPKAVRMADTSDIVESSQVVVAAINRLQRSIMRLAQAQEIAAAASAGFINPLALELLVYQVDRLKELALAQSEGISTAVEDAVVDVLSATQALTAQRVDRLQ